MSRYVAWLAIALSVMWAVLFGGGWWGIYNPALRVISVSLGLVGLTVWAAVAWHRPSWRPASALGVPIAGCLASLAVATAYSRFPRQSVEYLAYAIFLAALYLLLVRLLADSFFRARLQILMIGLAVVLAITYLVANVSHWISWWSLVGRLAVPPLRPASESLTYGNPSTAMTMVLLAACAAAAGVGVSTRGRAWVVTGLGALTALTILISGSRSGWFAVSVAAAVIGVGWLAGIDRRRAVTTAVRRELGRQVWRLATAGVGVAFFGSLVVLGPAIVRRITEGGENLRVTYVAAAWRMFTESPIVGTGPGTWVVQRVRYTYAPEIDYYIPHAHNVLFQSAAELGLVGLAAGAVLVAYLGRLVRDSIAAPRPDRRRWGWTALFALVYFGVHNLFDFYPNMPAILFAAAVPVAWLDATRPTAPIPVAPAPDRARRSWLAGAAGGLVVAVALIGSLVSESAALIHARAVNAYNVGDWAEADGLAREAVDRDPHWPPYQLTLGLAAAAVGDHDRAADAFLQVVEADDLPEAWLNLAGERAVLGDRVGALEALDRAARLGLQRPALAMAIGDLALRLGSVELGRTAFTEAVRMVPSLAGDPWWRADPVRAGLFAGIVDAAIGDSPAADRWAIALMAGDAERARALAVDDKTGLATALDVIAAWQGDEASMQRVRDTCYARPLDPAVLAWAARLERRRGDDAAAERWVAWAFVGNTQASSAGAETRVSIEVPVGRTTAGWLADFYGTYTYRRPTPWNPLVPSVVHLYLVSGD